jgi:NADPH:quinone reductase-like Zn-dependent oxidoreductase
MIDQGHRVQSYPFVPGLDGAGIVEAVGDDVKRIKIGDEILANFSSGDRTGAFQNFAVVHEWAVVKKPGNWSWEEAASIG